ncbi:MAG: hypothetical protein LBE30_04950 [Comamonas sp.]|jgi:hypothetical protein|nr:hypothetical protein [Comamonas sp.]
MSEQELGTDAAWHECRPRFVTILPSQLQLSFLIAACALSIRTELDSIEKYNPDLRMVASELTKRTDKRKSLRTFQF